jgi:abhydrolase domain-containing protein 17
VTKRKLLFGEFTFRRIMISIIEIYLIIMLFAWFYSEHIIFQPQRPEYQDTPDIIKLKTEDGEKISAFYLQNPSAEFTVLYSHGNAEDIGGLREILEIYRSRGYSILAYDYRGYGTSEGKPSEKKTYKDIRAAYKYLTETEKVPPEKIILHGRSLGAAVAIDLAAEKRVAGVISESAFVTAFRAMTVVPVFPLDRFRNNDKIKCISCPVLFIHGYDDRVIAIWHSQKLYNKAAPPKLHLYVEGAGHDDVVWVGAEKYWNAIDDFVTDIKVLRKEKNN